ncbi:MAG: DNA translocase FtsK 4TM domain-containing protein [Elusimicrobia bacterium]|nr:DNA translocase FtsK 4TM domain-containing protein [Elusimicrobiota bacterium]
MKRNDIRGLILLIIGILFLWFLFYPQHSGFLGLHTKRILLIVFGKASFIFPIVVLWIGTKLLFNKKLNSTNLKLISDIFIIWALCTILSLATADTPDANFGGFIGKYSEIGITKTVGIFGGWIISLGVIVIAVFLTTGVSFDDLTEFLSKISVKLKSRKKKSLSRPLEEPKEIPKVAIPKPIVIEKDEPKLIEKPEKEPKQPPIKKPDDTKEKKQPAVAAKIKKPETPKTEIKQLKYELPDVDMLDKPQKVDTQLTEDELRECAEKLIKTLSDFNISATIESINPGPVITRYDITLAPGTKVSSIINLSNDIALSMKTASIRVLAPIPGKSAVGIEIPNPKHETVRLKDVISSAKFTESKSLLTIALGKTTSGEPFCDDLAPMPHLLIAGATGSGKSVCINSIIMSILFRAKPDELKFLLIDPKRLELPKYNEIPHIYVPGKKASEASVITDAKEAAKALFLLTKVMDERYKRFAKKAVRNIEGYNELMEREGGKKEYYIVVIIDELHDLMLVAAKNVEEAITRLASMARAVGIHLILATQRPSVDVITGVIKANLPARIAFQVLSKTDSRVILDTNGADDLIGKGDMLYLPTGYSRPLRLQGNFVSLKEIDRVVTFIKKQAQPDYEDIFETIVATEKKQMSNESKKELVQALRLALERKRISYDLLKANGFGNRSADILSRLEVEGFIRKPEGTNRWEVFIDKIEEFLATTDSNG